jgi:predicted  nucleic acid-binding Zn-ribbon protein
MTEQELDALMSQSTEQFNALKVEEGTVTERLRQIDTALKQLQGEYEAYNTMKKTLAERAQTLAQASLNAENEAPPKPAKKEVVNASK